MNGDSASAIAWEAHPHRLHINAGEVHLWKADLYVGEDAQLRLRQFLSEEEKARADRFVFERDRHHWAAGRGMLREILGSYLGRQPASLEIVKQTGGKPRLGHDRQAGDPTIKFNLSHSGSLALLAVTLDREVGIDVEHFRPEVATSEIAERYFSPEEQSELHSVPEELRTEAFFLCWTRKEAFLKARGDGLRTPLDSFTVSLTPGRPAVLRCNDAPRWALFSFCPQAGSVAALVTEGGQAVRRFWQWQSRGS